MTLLRYPGGPARKRSRPAPELTCITNIGGLPGWEAWSNAVPGPKSLLLDASSHVSDVGMSDEELSEAEVLASYRARVPESVFNEALEFLGLNGE
jgi:hypothetical protein